MVDLFYTMSHFNPSSLVTLSMFSALFRIEPRKAPKQMVSLFFFQQNKKINCVFLITMIPGLKMLWK